MKVIIKLIIIILIFFKTGNVLSETSIFNVNNIKIDRNLYNKTDVFLNKVFQEGFLKLTKKILVKKDFTKVSNLSVREIRELVSHYEIIEPRKNSEKEIISNVFFDRNAINSFFLKRNISYSDLSSLELTIFPLYIRNENMNFFENNYFYKNWKTSDEQIEFVLPVESIELIENVKNFYKLGTSSIDDIFKEYNEKNNLLIILDVSSDKVKVLLKGKVNNKPIIKNISYNLVMSETIESYENLINLINDEIIEIYKSQNMIDLQTPSFLNFHLDIKEVNDVFRLNNFTESIDIIESFNVREITNDYAKIKIKFYGKIDKLIKKFTDANLKVELINSEWRIILNNQ